MLAAIKSRRHPKEQEQVHTVFVEVAAICKTRQNLCTTLTMADIANLVFSSLLTHIIDKSWLIVPPQLLKAIVPELGIRVGVEQLMMS